MTVLIRQTLWALISKSPLSHSKVNSPAWIMLIIHFPRQENGANWALFSPHALNSLVLFKLLRDWRLFQGFQISSDKHWDTNTDSICSTGPGDSPSDNYFFGCVLILFFFVSFSSLGSGFYNPITIMSPFIFLVLIPAAFGKSGKICLVEIIAFHFLVLKYAQCDSISFKYHYRNSCTTFSAPFAVTRN